MWIIFLICISILIFIMKGLFIIKKEQSIVVERFGSYNKVLKSGVHFLIPFVETPKKIITIRKLKAQNGAVFAAKVATTRIDMRDTIYQFPTQNIITRDDVKINLYALLNFKIIDAAKVAYSTNDFPEEIEKLTINAIKNFIKEHNHDELLAFDIDIDKELKEILNNKTSKFGVKINKIEIKDIKVSPAY